MQDNPVSNREFRRPSDERHARPSIRARVRRLGLAAGAFLANAGCTAVVPETGHPCPCDEVNYTCCSGANRCVNFSELPSCETTGNAGDAAGNAKGNALADVTAATPPDATVQDSATADAESEGMVDEGPKDMIEAASDRAVDGSTDPTVDAASDGTVVEAVDAKVDLSESTVDAISDTTVDAMVTAEAGPGLDAMDGRDACDSGVLSFVPSGGVDPADLDGCELQAFGLPVPPASDGGGDGAKDGAASDATDLGESEGGPSVVDVDPSDTVINVDTGEVSRSGTVIRPASLKDAGVRDVQEGIAFRINADNVAIVTFRSLAVPQGTTLKLFGSSVAGVVLASATTIPVDGVIEARAVSNSGVLCQPGAALVLGAGQGSGWSVPGAPNPGWPAPGGYQGGTGGYVSKYGVLIPATPGFGPDGLLGGGAGTYALPGGGGGGGHAGIGGNGGDGGGAGGGAYDFPTDSGTFFFHGGAGGGAGGGSVFAYGGAGGSGGGAIRLVAATSIAIGEGTRYGGINASGCGGGPGVQGDGISEPGGGGAGGSIELEAPVVTLGRSASLLAAGGGGGSIGGTGDGGPNLVPILGTSPDLGATDAMGCPWGGGAGGGWHGVDGERGNLVTPTGCGAGGAAGWIRISTRPGGLTISNAGIIVAPPADGGAFLTGLLSAP